MHQVLQFFTSDMFGFLVLIAFLVIGLLIIVLVVKAFFFLLPAAAVAVIVWWITRSPILTGIAFLVIAAISLARRK